MVWSMISQSLPSEDAWTLLLGSISNLHQASQRAQSATDPSEAERARADQVGALMIFRYCTHEVLPKAFEAASDDVELIELIRPRVEALAAQLSLGMPMEWAVAVTS